MNVWNKRLRDWRNWVWLFLFAIALYQAYLVVNGYALTWLKRAWRNRELSSMERSAQYYFGDTGSDFMKFIDSHVPQGMNVVVPGKLTQFARQNILQYYLFPRSILSCPCDQPDEACKACLQDPVAYIPAIDKFPPVDLLEGTKKFIPFESNIPTYAGIYVPAGGNASEPAQAAGSTPYHPLTALAIDLCVLGGFSFLGFTLSRLVVPRLNWVEALTLSVPLGAGLLTWVIFIVAWSRLPVVLPVVILIYGILAAGLLWMRWRLKNSPDASQEASPMQPHLPGSSKNLTENGFNNFRIGSKIKPVEIIAWVIVGCVFLVMTVLSINRSYSQFDDIAIWSMKGYGIAYTGTIFDLGYLGGHGLAYPLDLSLSITVFKLASGDVLPGSKFLFPLFTAALAFGCYRFWRRWGVNSALAWSGMLLLLTVPEIFLHSTLGFANLPFAAYLVLGVLWSVDGLFHEQPRSLLMGGLLLAFAAWTRPEGIVFAGILMIGLFLARLLSFRKPFFSIAWVAPLAIPGIWLLFAARYVAQDQAGDALSRLVKDLLQGTLSLAPLKMMVDYAKYTAVTPTTWGYIFPAAAVMLVVAIYRLLPRVNPPAFMLIPAAILAVLVPAGLFFIESSTDPDFEAFLTVSFNRAYIPAAFLIVTLAILALGTSSIKYGAPLDDV